MIMSGLLGRRCMGFMRGRVEDGADAFAAARPARGAEGSAAR